MIEYSDCQTFDRIHEKFCEVAGVEPFTEEAFDLHEAECDRIIAECDKTIAQCEETVARCNKTIAEAFNLKVRWF